MQTILLICDDETRRAQLHRQLLSDFEVYAVSHESAARMRKKFARKKVIIVEEEDFGASKKISIHPLTGKEGRGLVRLIKSILNSVQHVNLMCKILTKSQNGLLKPDISMFVGHEIKIQ